MNKKVATILVVLIPIFVAPLLVSGISGAQQDIYWEGQEVELTNNINPDTVYLIYTDEQEEFITQLGSDSSGVLEIDTGKYGTGDFQVVPEVGNKVADYTVASQSLNVGVNDSTAFEDDDIEFDINSKRLKFDVYLNATDVENNTIVNALDIPSSRLEVTDKNGVLIEDVDITTGNDDKIEMDSSNLPNDNINFVWNVTDTIDNSTVNVITVESELANVEFINGPYSSNIANPVQVNMSIEDTRETTVQIGTQSYKHNVSLRDDDEDGDISFTFDTFVAGNEGEKPVTTDDSGTEILSQDDDQGTPGELLDATSYTMEASVNGEVTAVDVIQLNEFNQEGIDVMSMSSEKRVNYTNIVNASESNEVSEGDYAIFDVKVSSIYSFVNNSTEPRQLEPGSDLSDNFGLSLVIKESEPSINDDAEELDLFNAKDLYTNKRENSLYVVVEGDELPKDFNNDEDEIDVVNEFEAEFTIDENSPIVEDVIDEDEDEFVIESNEELTVLEESVIPATRQIDDDEFVFDKEEKEIEVKTPIGDGREVTVVVEEIDSGVANLGTKEVSNGTVTFETEEVAELPVGEEFQLRVVTTDETYDMVVGINNLIEEFNLPEKADTFEEFEANVDLIDRFEGDFDIETEFQGPIGVERDIILEGIALTDNTSATVIGDSRFRDATVDTDDNGSAYISYEEEGDYELTAVAESRSELLRDTNEKTISIEENIPKPNVSLDAPTGTLFSSENLTFTSQETMVKNTDVTYDWSVNGESVGDGNELAYEFESAGSYDVGLTATNEESESDTVETSVTVYSGNQFTKSIFEYFTRP